MTKVAVLNVNSFARAYPEHLLELQEKVGKVERFTVDPLVNESDLAAIIGDSEYIIMGTSPVMNKAFFNMQKKIRLITRHGIGFNHIDVQAAADKGIYVCKMDGIIERDAVAEQALSLLTVCAKRLVLANEMVHNRQWTIERSRLMGVQLTRKVTGVIGLGNIGTRFAEIMHKGFQNHILVYDPFKSKEEIEDFGYFKVSLETLLQESDFISLHCNLTEDNRFLLNQSNLSLIRKSAILINTARGGLIDEDALAELLSKQEIGFYGADVSREEPMNHSHPLLHVSNAVFSPHVGVYNEQCIREMDQKVMEDIYLMEQGMKPRVIVNEASR